MALRAVPFQIKRILLLTGVQTEVLAPMTCQSVTIGNATTGDVRVISEADGSQYLTIASGFERIIWSPQPVGSMFQRDQIALWLQAVDTGTVILTWA